MANVHPRVLHVAADDAFASAAATVLTDDYSVEVRRATRGEEALDLLERERVDCVISDYDLPDTDGLALLDAVRGIDPGLPFVLLTADESEALASDAISAGVSEYFVKGVSEYFVKGEVDGLVKGEGDDTLAALADAVDDAVARRRGERLTDRQMTVNELLWDVSQTILRASSREAIERTVCERLAESESYAFAWIGKVDRKARVVRPQAAAGIGRRYLDPVMLDAGRDGRDRRPVRDAVETGSMQVERDLVPCESFDDAVGDDHYAVAAVPLTYEDRDYGVLSVWSDARYAFGETERRTLSKFGDGIASAIDSVQTRKELVRREQRLQVFNRILRHNLRNDLNVVLGRAENISEEFPPAERDAAVIEQKASELIEISEKAREVGKTLDRGGPTETEVDVVDCVERTCAEFRESYPDAEIRTDTSGSVRVYADKTLEAAISEVVENAIEHTDDSTVTVQVSTTDDGKWVDVTVLDDGPGIPAAEREVLAEGEETSLQHGSGLGLWLTNWIVGKFGGEVSFDDYHTDGSAVTLRLRRAAADVATPDGVSTLEHE